jgi:hypothetical protein
VTYLKKNGSQPLRKSRNKTNLRHVRGLPTKRMADSQLLRTESRNKTNPQTCAWLTYKKNGGQPALAYRVQKHNKPSDMCVTYLQKEWRTASPCVQSPETQQTIRHVRGLPTKRMADSQPLRAESRSRSHSAEGNRNEMQMTCK